MIKHQIEFVRTTRPDEAVVSLPHGDQEYILLGEGQTRVGDVTLRWNERLVELLGGLRDPSEGAVTLAAAKVGQILGDFLKSGVWTSIAAEVDRGQSERHVLTVRTNAAELYALPVELVPIGRATHAASLPGFLIRYEAPQTATAPEASVYDRTSRGRALFAWSTAGGKVDVGRHRRALDEAVSASRPWVTAADDNDVEEIEHASCAAIVEHLRDAERHRRPIAVLHILCHGAGVVGSGTGLALDNGEGNGDVDVVDARRLQRVLQPFAGMIRLVVISACGGSDPGPVGDEIGSVALALHHAGIRSVIASRFPLSWEGASVLARALYGAMLRDLVSLEEAVLSARAALMLLRGNDWAGMQLFARAADGDDTRPFTLRPYRGLAAFRPEHTQLFFGRDSEIAAMLRALATLAGRGAARFLVVAGASGTGKSSLVMAGVIPRWERESPTGRKREHLVMRVGSDLAATLTTARARRNSLGASDEILLVVDQFEEGFTTSIALETFASFVRELWSWSKEPGARIAVALTLRTDFLARCGEVVLDAASGLRLDKLACDPAHQVMVAQMDVAQLREAIERPARAVGLALEANLAELILRDAGAEPGTLPLMSHALDRMWASRRGDTLTSEAYEAIHRLSGALNAHAQAQVDGMDDDARHVARLLFVQLVQVGEGSAPDTRRRRALSELRSSCGANGERFDKVFARLVEARLLVAAEGEGSTRIVEIAHEALIRNWESLRGWIREERAWIIEREQLDGWVREWKQSPDALLTGSRLSRAEELAKRHRGELGEDARRLLDESQSARARAAEATRRAAQTRRRGVVGAFAVLLTTAVIFVALWRKASNAETDATTRRDEAGRAQRRAESERNQAVAARARAEASEKVTLSLVLPDPIQRALVLSEATADAPPSRGFEAAWSLASVAVPITEYRDVRGEVFVSLNDRIVFGDDSGAIRSRSMDGRGAAETIFALNRGRFVVEAVGPQRRWMVVDDRGESSLGQFLVRTDGQGAPVSLRFSAGSEAGQEWTNTWMMIAFEGSDERLVALDNSGYSARWTVTANGVTRRLHAPPEQLRSGTAGRFELRDGSGTATVGTQRWAWTIGAPETLRLLNSDATDDPVHLRSADGTVHVESAAQRERLRVRRTLPSGTDACELEAPRPMPDAGRIALSSNGQSVAAVFDDEVRVWSTDCEALARGFEDLQRTGVSVSLDEGSGALHAGHFRDRPILDASGRMMALARDTDIRLYLGEGDDAHPMAGLELMDAQLGIPAVITRRVTVSGFSNDGRFLVGIVHLEGTNERSIRVWQVRGRVSPMSFEAFASGDNWLAILRPDRDIDVVYFDRLDEPVRFSVHDRLTWGRSSAYDPPYPLLHMSADGRSMALIERASHLCILTATEHRCSAGIVPFAAWVQWDASGRWIALVNEDGGVTLYNVQTLHAEWSTPSPRDSQVRLAGLGMNGTRVTLRVNDRFEVFVRPGDAAGAIEVTETETDAPWRTNAGHVIEEVMDDGTLVVTRETDGSHRLHRLERGSWTHHLLLLPTHGCESVRAQFSRGGSALLLTCERESYLWQTRGDVAATRVVIRGHGLTLSADGEEVLAYEDRSLHLWTRHEGHSALVTDIPQNVSTTHHQGSRWTLSRDGEVATSTNGPFIHVVPLRWPRWVRMFQSATHACIATEQRVRYFHETPAEAARHHAACASHATEAQDSTRRRQNP